jgi:hypothetical protein
MCQKLSLEDGGKAIGSKRLLSRKILVLYRFYRLIIASDYFITRRDQAPCKIDVIVYLRRTQIERRRIKRARQSRKTETEMDGKRFMRYFLFTKEGVPHDPAI